MRCGTWREKESESKKMRKERRGNNKKVVRKRDSERRRGEMKREEGRGKGREKLPLGGRSSWPGQTRLILVSVYRPAALAPGIVEIHW